MVYFHLLSIFLLYNNLYLFETIADLISFFICVNNINQHWGSDFELSTKQSADVVAFSALLEEKLLPALVSISPDFFILLFLCHKTENDFATGAIGPLIKMFKCHCSITRKRSS